MENRNYYEKLYASVPEIIDVNQLVQMLGGVHERTARALIWRKEIPAVFLKNRYLIPKRNVIDYLVSKNYEELLERVEIAHSKMFPRKSWKPTASEFLCCAISRGAEES